VCQAFKIAEHNRGAELVGEPGQLLIKDRAELTEFIGVLRSVANKLGTWTFAKFTSNALTPRSARNAASHRMQPGTEALAIAERIQPQGEHQKGGLEGVFGIVSVLEHAPANAQDHRSVQRHQGFETRRITTLAETLAELLLPHPHDGSAAEERGEPIEGGIQ
jgi:hypothetical protein